jgi:GAF domain-containing protein/ANTAR domain-containing protein
VDDLAVWRLQLGEGAVDRLKEPLRICNLCVVGLHVGGCAISMVTPAGNGGVVCATDDTSARIEDLQFSLGEGPGLDAARTGEPVLIADMLARLGPQAGSWPAFSQGAASVGARAVFAFPLRIGPVSMGALGLYRLQPGSLSADELTGAVLASQAAASALTHLDGAAADLFSDDREARTSYRLEVHQAAGMITVQAGVGIEDALAMLRARAYSTGRTLAQVARDVVERRLRFSAEEV